MSIVDILSNACDQVPPFGVANYGTSRDIIFSSVFRLSFRYEGRQSQGHRRDQKPLSYSIEKKFGQNLFTITINNYVCEMSDFERTMMMFSLNNVEAYNITGWKTNCTHINGSFLNCTSLKSVRLILWKLPDAKSLFHLFHYCPQLKDVECTCWKLPNLESTARVFFHCDNLENVSFRSWASPKLSDMDYCFHRCTSLKRVEILSVDFSNLKSIKRCFAGCTSLEEVTIKGVSDTFNLLDMEEMFIGCENLEFIDLDGLNVDNVMTFKGCFKGCKKLVTVKIKHWLMNNNAITDELFNGCDVLRNIRCTKYLFDRLIRERLIRDYWVYDFGQTLAVNYYVGVFSDDDEE